MTQAPSSQDLQWVQSSEALAAIAKTRVKVPLEQLEFDLLRQYGQPRELDLSIVQKKVESFKNCPPLGPLQDILLLQVDPSRTRRWT